MIGRSLFLAAACLAPLLFQAGPLVAQQTSTSPAPQPVTRTYDVTQTVTLKSIPKGAKQVRMWIALPDDAPQQKVLDIQVRNAPPGARMERDAEYGNRFLYAEFDQPRTDSVSVTVDFSVRRDPVHIDLDAKAALPLTDAHRALLAEYLRGDVPLMEVTPEIRQRADAACGTDTNIVVQSRKLFDHVADFADHYSKDPSKPTCGRGAAQDCVVNQGGCCTDLHSLFIAMARARGIPTRLQFGLRLQAKNLGKEVDPGYRCWVEFFVPGYGWAPTDIVAADAGDAAGRNAYFAGLDERRLWYCEGRNFDLVPRQTGPKVNTMIIGLAEIDGVRVPVLPAEDGTPSPLSRTVKLSER